MGLPRLMGVACSMTRSPAYTASLNACLRSMLHCSVLLCAPPVALTCRAATMQQCPHPRTRQQAEAHAHGAGSGGDDDAEAAADGSAPGGNGPGAGDSGNDTGAAAPPPGLSTLEAENEAEAREGLRLVVEGAAQQLYGALCCALDAGEREADLVAMSFERAGTPAVWVGDGFAAAATVAMRWGGAGPAGACEQEQCPVRGKHSAWRVRRAKLPPRTGGLRRQKPLNLRR